ncbi:MAG: thioredoxin domain-containing protein [Aquificae bacterium]|nr:thioredoxin domain-containing protein [Aquificota bacterium]
MKNIKNTILGTILSSAVLLSFSKAENPAKGGEAQNIKTGWEQCLYPETVTKSEVYEKLKPFLKKGHEVLDVRKSPIPGIYEVILVRDDKVIPVYVDCNLEHFFYGRVQNIHTKENLVEKAIKEYADKTLDAKKEILAKRLGKEKAKKLIEILGEKVLKNIQFINPEEIPKDNNVVLGNPEGKVVLYSVEEPECIHCAEFAPKIEKLLEKYKDIKLEVILIPWSMHPDGAKVIERVICEKDPKKKVEILEKAFKATREKDKETIKKLGKECKFGNVIAQRNWIFFSRNQIKATPALILPNGVVITDREILKDEKKLEEILKIIVS